GHTWKWQRTGQNPFIRQCLAKQGGVRSKRNCTVKTPPTHPARPNNCRRRLRTRETCRRPAQINPPSHAPGARIRASASCGTTVLHTSHSTACLRSCAKNLVLIRSPLDLQPCVLQQARGFHATRSPYRSASLAPSLSRKEPSTSGGISLWPLGKTANPTH